MTDGIYSIAFRGTADWGMGLLLLRKGTVTGVDVAGVKYDGRYIDGVAVEVSLVLTVPPGTTLVQGTKPQPSSFTFEIKTTLPKEVLGNGTPHRVETKFGPVNVTFRKLRDITD